MYYDTFLTKLIKTIDIWKLNNGFEMFYKVFKIVFFKYRMKAQK